MQELELQFEMPPDEDFGPVMRSLQPKQRAFVVALAMTGGKGNGAEAAVLCGCNPGNTAKVYAYRMTHHPKFGAAAREWSEHLIHGGVFTAISTILTIAADPMHKDAFKAADRVLERAGMHVAQVLEVKHEHEVKGLTDLVQNIKRLAASAEQAKLLLASAGVPQQIIDAEFSEVRPALPAPSSSAGLEDLL